jgi:hypothetical protein
MQEMFVLPSLIEIGQMFHFKVGPYSVASSHFTEFDK